MPRAPPAQNKASPPANTHVGVGLASVTAGNIAIRPESTCCAGTHGTRSHAPPPLFFLLAAIAQSRRHSLPWQLGWPTFSYDESRLKCKLSSMEVAVFDTKSHDRQYLQSAPHAEEIEWRLHEFRLSSTTARAAAGCAAACLFVNDVADAACLEVLAGGGTRLLALRCAGFNNVDLGAAKALGLKVVRVPAYSPHAVAEHTVALLLTLNRKIHRAYNRVREHNFSLNGLVGFDIFGKTVGVIGTGKIGRIAAGIFKGFGARVLAYDPQCDSAWAAAAGVEYVPMGDLLAASDIVSLHLPLLPTTHHLLNRETFAQMKRGAYLVNTSRGKLVDTAALLEVLKSSYLGGVALDVYEEEEGIFFEDLSGSVLQDDDLSRLLTFPNVLITSHQAFFTHEALSEIARVTVGNLARFKMGRPFLDQTVLA